MPFDREAYSRRVTQALQFPKPTSERGTNCLGLVWWCLGLTDTEQYISPIDSGDYLLALDKTEYEGNSAYSFKQNYLGMVIAQLPRLNVWHAAVLHPTTDNLLIHRAGNNSQARPISIKDLVKSYDRRQEVFRYFVFQTPRF